VPSRDIVVLGASAGGVEAVLQIIKRLPADLPASVFVAMHFPPTGSSILPQILERAGKLPATHAVHGEKMRYGQIYVARPDYHLVLEPNEQVALSSGPRENGHRPAIDALMRSAALLYRERVVGVVLSGLLDDGAAGLKYVQIAGGATIVQDPADALFDGMPRSALDAVTPDHLLPAAEIADVLDRLARDVASTDAAESGWREPEADMSTNESVIGENPYDPHQRAESSADAGPPSVYTCPECSGTLWEVGEDDLLRFRCRVGHTYSLESMLSDQDRSVEAAVWTALRSLEESAALKRRLARDSRTRGNMRLATRFAEQAKEVEERIVVLRVALGLTRDAARRADHPQARTGTK
jgi:two-component system, chemotaxis family, protein-glutamate methylesterase/glutaminase